MKEFDYIAQAFADYVDVREGRKPLLIVSAGKSDFAETALRRLAMEDRSVQYEVEAFVCEDGELWQHLFVTQAGAPYAREARDAIVDCISEAILTRSVSDRRYLRVQLQTHLGHLLGYSAYEIDEFVNSQLGRTCPCDCCGSEFTAQPTTLPDRHASGRFIENSYQY